MVRLPQAFSQFKSETGRGKTIDESDAMELGFIYGAQAILYALSDASELGTFRKQVEVIKSDLLVLLTSRLTAERRKHDGKKEI